jgi:mutator family transposase
MRNALATVPKVAQQMVAATLRTVFAQPDQASAHETVERICRLFEQRYPQLVKVVQEAEVDVLAYFSFPVEHRRQIWSTNSLERLNKEVSRRCDVVGIFPNRAALLRLTGAVLEEQNDEWAVGRRYFSTDMTLSGRQSHPTSMFADSKCGTNCMDRTRLLTPRRQYWVSISRRIRLPTAVLITRCPTSWSSKSVIGPASCQTAQLVILPPYPLGI